MNITKICIKFEITDEYKKKITYTNWVGWPNLITRKSWPDPIPFYPSKNAPFCWKQKTQNLNPKTNLSYFYSLSLKPKIQPTSLYKRLTTPYYSTFKIKITPSLEQFEEHDELEEHKPRKKKPDSDYEKTSPNVFH